MEVVLIQSYCHFVSFKQLFSPSSVSFSFSFIDKISMSKDSSQSLPFELVTHSNYIASKVYAGYSSPVQELQIQHTYELHAHLVERFSLVTEELLRWLNFVLYV